MKKVLHFLLSLSLVVLCSTAVFGQGATTATMNGQVTDPDGNPLPGATVIALHTPTGSQYGGITNDDGFYRIANLKVGGPYKVTISFVGYEPSNREGVFLSLGQTYRLDMGISTTSQELDAVEVIAREGDLFDGSRTGSETYVGKEQIESLPTVTRNFYDFARLTPQSNSTGSGLSIAGTNNRYNAIFIDGAVNNDVFGLANSGTNGGQTGMSPISPDALDQVQVVVAPYDVTLGGFAGGGINAVTRSGTNELSGSAYYFTRNENLAGKTPTDVEGADRTKLDPFNANTFGFRLGGPIIKDKLFFFTNVELERKEEPKPFDWASYEGDSNQEDIENFISYLANEHGYDPGGYLNNVETNSADRILVKLDWNMSDKHKLSMRHSYAKLVSTLQDRPNDREMVFFNSGTYQPSTTNSFAAELKSTFNNTVSNNLKIGVTTVRDNRNILGNPFPRLEIQDGGATIYAGTDAFSFSNIVFQDVMTLTDDVTWYKGKHTFTVGTHNELFNIQNLFSVFSTPLYNYNSLDQVVNNEGATTILFGHEQALNEDLNTIRFGDEGTRLGPTFSALQMAFYAQDEIQVNPNFKLSLGLRADVPIYLDDAPTINTGFNEETIPMMEMAGYDLKGAQAGVLPNNSVLFSPRVGFNLDVTGDKSTQIRGGVGVFTSRIPWVWPGGMYIRSGLNSSFVFKGNWFADTQIYATPEDWRENLATPSSPSGDVDLFAPDFKYPQVLRGSLAVDQKLPGGLEGTVEFIYTNKLNDILVQQVNLVPSTQTLEGADNRAFFSGDDIDGDYGRVAFVDNTNEGYTYNFTAQVKKPMTNGLTASLAYSYTRAESIFDGQSFINSTQWRTLHAINGRNNNFMLQRSAYDFGSRVTGYLTKRFTYGKGLGTTVSLFYNAQSGQPFSYIYANGDDMTGEDSESRALIYVPASSSDIALVDTDEATAAAQWSALDAFISNDEYLNSRRGDYAERNESRTPFTSIIDFKIVQDFSIQAGSGTKHNFQFTFDIFNFGNFLNKDWGRRYFVGNAGNFNLIRFEGFATDAAGNETLEPTFSFQDPGDPWSISQSGVNSARWAGQIGLRYSF